MNKKDNYKFKPWAGKTTAVSKKTGKVLPSLKVRKPTDAEKLDLVLRLTNHGWERVAKFWKDYYDGQARKGGRLRRHVLMMTGVTRALRAKRWELRYARAFVARIMRRVEEAEKRKIIRQRKRDERVKELVARLIKWIKKNRPPIRTRHPYHILDASPFPLLVGLFTFSCLVPLVFYLHGLDCPIVPNSLAIHLSFCGLFYTVMAWFIAIVDESNPHHTRKVQHGLRMGVILFIVSEIMLFFSFFWAFFHVSLIPAITVGAMWPPIGTQILDVWGLPFVNTLLLLTSGVTITIAHAKLTKNNYRGFSWNLLLTILLGVTFLICQGYEYKYGVKFSWRENIYGSIFFITTGFHGMHVTVGTLLLAFCWTRNHLVNHYPRLLAWIMRGSAQQIASKDYYKVAQARWGFAPTQHIGFEAAAWYWHFVDVVWLFLFITIYWWGGRL